MPSNWKEPTAEGVSKVMLLAVVDRVTQDETQVDELLSMVILRIRGTVSARGFTLSASENEVPPEALQHAHVLATALLLTAQPNMPGLVMRGDGGSETGFAYFVKRAEAWLTWLQEDKDASVTYPTDPMADASGSGLVRWGSDDVVVTDAA